MFKVKFADIGEGLTEGKVVEVLVKVGDVVKAGDGLFFVETDKVNSEIPAPVDGKIAKILIKPDQEIKVGDVVIEIDESLSTTKAEDSTSSAEEKPIKKDEPEEENASVVGSTPVSNTLLPSRAPKKKAKTSETGSRITVASQTKTLQKQDFKIPDAKFHYDVIVIGGGIGGYVCAIKSAQLGLKTLIVEKSEYGGVCLNIGCIPTKTLLKSAKLYDQTLSKTEAFGVEVTNPYENVKIHWDVVQKRKTEVVKKLTSGVLFLLNKNKVVHLEGEAKALDAHTIEVKGQKYTGDNLVIATGSKPNGLTLPGFEQGVKDGFVIDSTAALSLPKIPQKLIIIGGGVIGIEFACLYSNLGTEVTILQGLPTILEMLDGDISQEMTKLLIDKYGVKIIPNVQITGVEKQSVKFKLDGKEQTLSADYCLQSVGRKAITQGFDDIGLEKTDRGYLAISNEYCQTNLENVYAIGDVNGRLMLAHVANHEGIIAANHIAAKKQLPKAEDIKMNFNHVPSCVYAHPEIAVVGRTEEQCKQEGLDYQTTKFPFSAIGKAQVDGHPYGFVKLIIDKKYQAILGAHIIGNRATEMISEITAVMECEGTVAELSHAITPHPTMSEAVSEAAEALWTGKTLNL